MEHKSALPPGWFRELLTKADFEASYARLEGIEHFYAETMRGRIRSLQLRIEEAWRCFDRALRWAQEAPTNVPNIVREYLLHLFLFENTLLAGPVDRKRPPPFTEIPEIPARVIQDYPEVHHVLGLRKSAEATLRLHLGDYHASATLFEELIQSYGGTPDAVLALHYCGAAAAQHNLGLVDEARRNLENAALAVQSGGDTLNRAKVAGLLMGLHAFLGTEGESEEWRAYLTRMECPEPTQDAFRRRGKLLLDRCVAQSSCLVL